MRTQDDTGLKELMDAGATEVVPETFEASLMLVSHTLMLLNTPVSRVVRTIGHIRENRYSTLRSLFRRSDALAIDESHTFREELKTVVLPPGAWSVGRSLGDVKNRGGGGGVHGCATRRDRRTRSVRRPSASRRGHRRDLWPARSAGARGGRAARGLGS